MSGGDPCAEKEAEGGFPFDDHRCLRLVHGESRWQVIRFSFWIAGLQGVWRSPTKVDLMVLLRAKKNAPSSSWVGAIVSVLIHAAALGEGEVLATQLADFQGHVQPFFANYCIECHGEKKQKADFTVHDIDPLITNGNDIERWEKVLEMVSNGDMPPDKAIEFPSGSERRELEKWIDLELKKIGRGPDEGRLSRPEFGNRVNHEELFSGEHLGPASSPPRLWRRNLQIHRRFELENRLPQGSIPFTPQGGRGFQDYATLLANEATIKTLRINSKNYLAEIIDGRLVNPKGDDGKADQARQVREGKSRWQEFHDLVHVEGPASNELLDKAVVRGFQLLLRREPTPEELARYSRGFLKRGIEIAGPRDALESLLTALILKPEFIYRQELGLGKELGDGRRMLSPREISHALAYALTDSPPDGDLIKAVEAGRLTSKEDVEREVRRILSQSTKDYWGYEINHTFEQHVEACPNPRVLRFFREFFAYDRVFDVFKDKSRNEDHKPNFLFKDADLFVLSILEEDQNVLYKLLTSNRYVVHYSDPNRVERTLKGMLAGRDGGRIRALLEAGHTPVLGSYRGGQYYSAYGFEKDSWNYPVEQPFEVEHRAGILTHPAWLVAHSGNFDTDPIRRGKWIREHLLADTIPEIPIGVDAKLEEDPHKTLRERAGKTTEESCWRCHKKMNPLGMPFEIFDDFGRFRTRIVLGDADGYFQAKRKYDSQKRNWEKELEEWRGYDARGRAEKVAYAQLMLDGLEPPEAGGKKDGKERKAFESQQKRWRSELDKWLKIDDEEQKRRIRDLEDRLDGLAPPVPEAKPVDASGELTGTGDPKLDGHVKDAFELVERLAASELARQSFVRHAFRYWMGRNEILNDSPTLMAADRAYVESGGSFRELLVSLLTSDSFLTRKDE